MGKCRRLLPEGNRKPVFPGGERFSRSNQNSFDEEVVLRTSPLQTVQERPWGENRFHLLVERGGHSAGAEQLFVNVLRRSNRASHEGFGTAPHQLAGELCILRRSEGMEDPVVETGEQGQGLFFPRFPRHQGEEAVQTLRQRHHAPLMRTTLSQKPSVKLPAQKFLGFVAPDDGEAVRL